MYITIYVFGVGYFGDIRLVTGYGRHFVAGNKKIL